MLATQVSHSRDTDSVRGEAATLAAETEKLREQLTREHEASRQAAAAEEKLRGELDRAQAQCRQLDAAAEKLRGELARAQEASRQLAAGSCAEAVRSAAEIERLERELAAARSAHSRAVTTGNKARLIHDPEYNPNIYSLLSCLECDHPMPFCTFGVVLMRCKRLE